MQVHPILGSPFYSVHPCQTGAAMQHLLGLANSTEASKDLHCRALPIEGPTSDAARAPSQVVAGCHYLIRWFSMLGPAVGLQLPRNLWP